MNKFKIGDFVKIGDTENDSPNVIVAQMDEHYRVYVGDHDIIGDYSEWALRLQKTVAPLYRWGRLSNIRRLRGWSIFKARKKQTMSENKNELKIGCHTLTKCRTGEVKVLVSNPDPCFHINPDEVSKIQSFLSTPYQEEEVYLKADDVVEHILTGNQARLVFLRCATYVLISLDSGENISGRVGMATSKGIPSSALGLSLGEWRVLPRESELS